MRKKTISLLVIIIFLVIVKSRLLVERAHQEILWNLECALGVHVVRKCAIHGGWTPWTAWSPCQGSCDQMGHRTRKRDCTNPAPAYGGIWCIGSNEEIESCNILDCTPDDYKQVIQGDVARTDAMRVLETVPSLIDRCLPSDCLYEVIESALSVDNTLQLNPENLWNALLCVKFNVGCTVNGGWGTWGEWSPCGARCGYGMQSRSRRCDTPTPSESQYMCSGSPVQLRDCIGEQCATERHRLGGSWTQWGKWSPCSETCGIGIRHRRRTCLEIQTPLASGSWGTHCRGPQDKLQMCHNKKCSLNGGWSAWGHWGPCSQTCGAGKRLRSRSCTRPIPSGDGLPCAGPKTEVGSCYLTPCEVYRHTVGVFNGKSHIYYRILGDKGAALMHFYIRFLPLSPQAMILRRGRADCTPYFRMTLQKWHICLQAAGVDDECEIPQYCFPNPVQPAVWHTVMITVTPDTMTLRLNDDPIAMKYKTPCPLRLPIVNLDIIVGETFRGEIQEVIFNFDPFQLEVEVGREFADAHIIANKTKAAAVEVVYETADMEEAFVLLDKEYYMRIPCFTDPEEWNLELTVKPNRDSGTILFLNNEKNWLHISLESSRVRVKLAIGDYRSESISFSEYLKDNWLDISVSKKTDTKSIETVINGGERLHVIIGEDIDRNHHDSSVCEIPSEIFEIKSQCPINRSTLDLCVNAYFIGGVPEQVKDYLSETFTPFCGYIASIRLNSVLYDLHEISRERYQNSIMQLSSRAASVSKFYVETGWDQSEILNLSCFPVEGAYSTTDIIWLSLDTQTNKATAYKNGIATNLSNSTDVNAQPLILQLIALFENMMSGFYTCRETKKMANIITYGVVGFLYKEVFSPECGALIAVFISMTLIAFSVGWLVEQGVHDLSEGHGFFRDDLLTPEEVARAIAHFIDDNRELIGNVNTFELNKNIMRRLELKAIRDGNVAAQEPQGLMQDTSVATQNMPPDVLPSLPNNVSLHMGSPRDIFGFEPNYVSTPQHGSIISPRKKFASSSSAEGVSPRFLSSRIIDAKSRLSSRESVGSQRKQVSYPSSTWAYRYNARKSTRAEKKKAKKIIDLFEQLQNDD